MCMNETIFVQVAAYRDPELVPTVIDLIEQAHQPENLHISIAWQHAPDETIEPLSKYDQIEVIDIPHTQAQGVCWARGLLQSRYKGETYTLSLDSHHRFVPGWDTHCKGMIQQLKTKGHSKPLLTAYLPAYAPDNDPAGRVQVPWKMDFDRFIPEGAVFFIPAAIPDFARLTDPIPARFVSAHFIFTLGSFCTEVPYDPHYYFHGEEINLTVRAYTHGYDLFHPHQVIAWHEYSRKGRTKQWDDDPGWVLRNQASHTRNRQLFKMDHEPRTIKFGKYGFGKVRPLAAYEQYSGLCFRERAVLPEVLAHQPPPCTSYPRYAVFKKNLCKMFKHCIDIQYHQVPEPDYEFWCVAFKDRQGNEIYREDASRAEIDRMFADPDRYCKIWRQFQCKQLPYSWVVWPYSTSKKWDCPPIVGNFANVVS